MVFGLSSLINLFQLSGLIDYLLVHLAVGQKYRQQELLYGMLSRGTSPGLGRSAVEYIFLPRARAAVGSPKACHDAGMNTGFYVFPDKVTSESNTSMTTDLHVGDCPIHNALRSEPKPVDLTNIFRLEDEVTSEYYAGIVEGDKCFGEVWIWNPSTDSYNDAPGNIVSELTELCQKGFNALEPIPDLKKLDGSYSGNGFGKTLSLEFQKGSLRAAGSSVYAVNEDCRLVLYYPVCRGIIAVMTKTDSLPTEKTEAYMILKKPKIERKWKMKFWGKNSKTEAERVSFLSGDDSDPLCESGNFRRTLNRKNLGKWDLDLPKKFNIGS